MGEKNDAAAEEKEAPDVSQKTRLPAKKGKRNTHAHTTFPGGGREKLIYIEQTLNRSMFPHVSRRGCHFQKNSISSNCGTHFTFPPPPISADAADMWTDLKIDDFRDLEKKAGDGRRERRRERKRERKRRRDRRSYALFGPP